ncbi:MAG: hypothetical protein ACYDAE_23170 [Steroidobacteraceae bacterium]
MTGFPATKLTELVDPIAEAWSRVNPRWPLPVELGGPGGAPQPMRLPDPPRWNVWLLKEPAQTPAPSAVQDAELGPGKFLGKPCPRGHRVRYCSTGQCVVCLRAAVKLSSVRRKAA